MRGQHEGAQRSTVNPLGYSLVGPEAGMKELDGCRSGRMEVDDALDEPDVPEKNRVGGEL
jgi:hypothetical protein